MPASRGSKTYSSHLLLSETPKWGISDLHLLYLLFLSCSPAFGGAQRHPSTSRLRRETKCKAFATRYWVFPLSLHTVGRTCLPAMDPRPIGQDGLEKNVCLVI